MVESTKAAGIPVYVRIRETLRAEITKGLLKRGERLPPEHELASRFRVSRMTVRESIGDLVDEGLLYRRHGVGTFVAYPHVQRDHTRLTSFFDRAENEGFECRVELLSLEVMLAPAPVARGLDLPPGSQVMHVRTLRFIDDLPVTVHDAYVPHSLFSATMTEGLEAEHLWSLFEKHGYRVKRAIQKLEARGATKEMAGLMKIKEHTPILFKERTVYADDGTPVEYTLCYNRGDAYSLTVALER